MSKVQLEAAKALIEEKRYAEARALLETIDHPTATKWLSQLDKIAPVVAPKKARRKNRWPIAGGLLLACIVVYAIGSNPELAKQRDATATARAIAALGTDDARNTSQTQLTQTSVADMTNIALTPSATMTETLPPTNTFTPSATFTATNTPTITATSTITDTPLPTATSTDTPPPSATSRPRGYIHKDDFGDEWPFTVEDGIVACERGSMVVFRASGKTYAVNGTARGFIEEAGYVDFEEIWRDDPSGIFPKVDISPIIGMGLDLC